MQDYKRPESVLVVIYCRTTGRVLMLQRNDDLDFWQSVTGSLEADETPQQTARREVFEETAIDIVNDDLLLIDCEYSVEYEIFPQFRYRYAPGVTRNLEHWFYLGLDDERAVTLTEHQAFRWLEIAAAADLTKSWNNRRAIEQLITNGIWVAD
jgi:dATP pyrophosphohydrolase